MLPMIDSARSNQLVARARASGSAKKVTVADAATSRTEKLDSESKKVEKKLNKLLSAYSLSPRKTVRMSTANMQAAAKYFAKKYQARAASRKKKEPGFLLAFENLESINRRMLHNVLVESTQSRKELSTVHSSMSVGVRNAKSRPSLVPQSDSETLGTERTLTLSIERLPTAIEMDLSQGQGATLFREKSDSKVTTSKRRFEWLLSNTESQVHPYSLLGAFKAALQGVVDYEYVAEPNRCFQLYVCSAGADTEVDRCYIAAALRQLREQLAIFGFDLAVFDPRLGSGDLELDRHNALDIVQSFRSECEQQMEAAGRWINLCTAALKPAYYLCVLGERCGPTTLIKHIDAERYDQLQVEMKREREIVQRSMQDLARRKKALAASRATIGSLEYTTDLSTHSTSVSDRDIDTLTEPTNASSAVIEINPDHAERLMEITDHSLLEQWYALDSNLEQARYCLVPITKHFPDINRGDFLRRKQAIHHWNEIKRRVSHMLVHHLFNDDVTSNAYLESDIVRTLLEVELRDILPRLSDGHDQLYAQSFWVLRSFEDILDHVEDVAAPEYLDMAKASLESPYTLNTEAHKRIMDIRADIVRTISFFRREILIKSEVAWNEKGLLPRDDLNHSYYLDHLGRDCYEFFCANLLRSAAKWIETNEKLQLELGSDQQLHLYKELHEHIRRLRQLEASTESVRSEEEQRIVDWLNDYDNEHQLLILSGPIGSGKSTLVARCLKACPVKGVTLLRFVGGSSRSLSIDTLIADLCYQIMQLLALPSTKVRLVPTWKDRYAMVNKFHELLDLLAERTRVLLVVDAIERLSTSNEAFDWLPLNAPANTKVLVSATSPSPLLDTLNKHCRNALFIGLQPLQPLDTKRLLLNWLRRDKRKLSEPQLDDLADKFSASRYGDSLLFLRMLYLEIRNSTPQAVDPLCRMISSLTPKSAFQLALAKVENDIGDVLVRRALTFLTLSKTGLSDTEMEDVLSLDDVTMDDVMTARKLALRHFPVSFWIRVRNALHEFLIQLDSRWQWRYVICEETILERYIAKERPAQLHKILAEFWSGRYAGMKPKLPQNLNMTYIFDQTRVAADYIRYVAQQPVAHDWQVLDIKVLKEHLDDDAIQMLRTHVVALNERKVDGLAYHLLQSQSLVEAKLECLFNYDWLVAKIRAGGVDSLIAYVDAGLDQEPLDRDLKLLAEAIHYSAKALQYDAAQLYTQLSGRLFDILEEEAHGLRELAYPYTQRLLASFRQACRRQMPTQKHSVTENVGNRVRGDLTLLPNSTILVPPKSLQRPISSFCPHESAIIAICVSNDGTLVSTAHTSDCCLVWQFKSKRVRNKLDRVGARVLDLHFAHDNNVLVTSETDSVRMWLLTPSRRADFLLRVVEQDDPAAVAVSEDLPLVAVLYAGQSKMTVWNVAQPIVCKAAERNIGLESGTKGKQPSNRKMLAARLAIGNLILCGLRGASSALVLDMNGNERCRLRTTKPGCLLVALARTSEYFVLGVAANARVVVDADDGLQELTIFQLELFSINGRFVRVVRGCPNDELHSPSAFGGLHTSRLGTHAFAATVNRPFAYSSIAVFNLETEEHRHVAMHAQCSENVCGIELGQLLSAGSSDPTVRSWNAVNYAQSSAPILSSSTSSHSDDGEKKVRLDPDPLRSLVGDAERYANIRPHIVALSSKHLLYHSSSKRKLAVLEFHVDAVRMRADYRAVSTFGLIQSRLEFAIRTPIAGPTDVLVYSRSRLVVLTNRVHSGFTAMLVYDAFNNRLVRANREVFVHANAETEYLLVDSEPSGHLITLSEQRSHLLVYTTTNGQLAKRIRLPCLASTLQVTSQVLANFNSIPVQLQQQAYPNPNPNPNALMPIFGDAFASIAPANSENDKRSKDSGLMEEDQRAFGLVRAFSRAGVRNVHQSLAKVLQAQPTNTARIVDELNMLGEVSIDRLAFSDDYQLLVAAFSDGALHCMVVFELDSGAFEPVRILFKHDCMLRLDCFAFTRARSSDSRRHFVHTAYNEAHKCAALLCWTLPHGEIRKQVRNVGNVCDVALTRSGDLVAFVNAEESVNIWTVGQAARSKGSASALLRLRRPPTLRASKWNVAPKIAFILNEQALVLAAEYIVVWRIADSSVLLTFVPDFAIFNFVPLLDGKVFVYQSRDAASLKCMFVHLRDDSLPEETSGKCEEDEALLEIIQDQFERR